jgi:hypothetical protein
MIEQLTIAASSRNKQQLHFAKNETFDHPQVPTSLNRQSLKLIGSTCA